MKRQSFDASYGFSLSRENPQGGGPIFWMTVVSDVVG